MDLSQYRWKNRLLLLFAPSPADVRFREQRRLFAGGEAGFEDRDLLLLELLKDTEARERFGVEEGRFALVLVGKDGTEKFRSHEPVPTEDVFSRVDAMPMRRRERGERETERDAKRDGGLR